VWSQPAIEAKAAILTPKFSTDEVLAVDQDPLGKQAARVTAQGSMEVWAKPLADGSRAVGLFNRGAEAGSCTARWSDLGVTAKQTVRDLWRQKTLGRFDDKFETVVPAHSVVLVRLMPTR
jgi:alpha-galactosidase